MGFSART